jgi:hypothetical protein
MIGFIDRTLYSSPLHTHYDSESLLAVSWQRIYNSLAVTTARIKSLKSQLNSLSSILNHLRLPSQETPSIISSAGLGSSLYSFGTDSTENTVSVVIAQQNFDCCLHILCALTCFRVVAQQ